MIEFGSERQLRRIADELAEIVSVLRGIFPRARSATLIFLDSKGRRIMPAVLTVGQTATAVLHEFTGPNGTGTDIKPIGPVSYSTSDATIATVDAASGLVTAVAAGVATITGTDAGNSLSASDTVSDTPLKAQSATLVITPN
jgi:hypothetical protein